jgi:hypothetical protein
MAIFGATNPAKSRIYQVGAATATFDDSPGVLLGVNIQIQRNLSPVPTLTDGIVWSAQPVQGTLTANSIVTADKNLVSKLTDNAACTPIPININLTNSCETSGVRLEIQDGYCSAVTFTASGQQGYIGNDFTVQFTVCSLLNT